MKQPRHEMGLEIASVSIPYPGHTWKGKCRRRFLEQMMTHVWEGCVVDRVCVLRSLLQENTFRLSAVPKHMFVRMYRFECLIVLRYLYNVLYIIIYVLVFLCVYNVN